MPAAPLHPDQPARQGLEHIQEFERAILEYKQTSGRMFPTWSEVLEVCRTLGYEKKAAAV